MRGLTVACIALAITASGCGKEAATSVPEEGSVPDTSIIPADRFTVWHPGIYPAGVPARTTVCATVNASTYGNGSSDASAGIQAALDACPDEQAVQLSAGTFLINNYFLGISKGITLRGAGAGTTILKRTNGASPGSENAGVADPVVFIGPQRWPGPDDSTSQGLTIDGAKGSYSVTVGSGSGFAAGQFVLLDEDNYNTGAWQSLPNRNGQPTPVKVWATDRAVWMRHNPTAGEDDPFPDSLSWFSRSGRPIAEVKEVASVSGNVVTFTTPLHISYRVSHTAQLTRYTGQNVHVKNAGLEDLTVYGGGDGNVRFEDAAYSWMRNVEDTVWLGEGVAINNSFRIEVRDSYIHDAAWPEPGGGGYAISFANGTADTLVENNIVIGANKVMVARSSGAGSVIGYNYMDDGHILTAPDWVEVGINGSHEVGSHHMLFEGNESFNYDSDFTHGNAIYHTVFRNHLSGFRRDFPGMQNARAGGLMYGSWWHSFVGNVMGTAGRMSGWLYEDPGDGTYGNPWGEGTYIWKLGYDATEWSQDADPQVHSTVLREGNFDYVTNQVHWDTTAQTIPPSLYLTSKPAFFGSLPWPWVDPTGATKLYTLPAKARYDAMHP
ncbi:MAG TPA: pectate lyase [Spirochaetia bacterium]|nr:pectate lyase [Spirochaetia bacterium]